MELAHTPPRQLPASPKRRTSVDATPASFRSDLPRWRQLASAPWLAALLAGEPVAAAPAAHWLLFDVACDGLDAYLGGHIPGAQYQDTRQFEHLPFWNAVPHDELLQVLQHVGVGPGSTVILYGRNMLAAARVAHLLLVAGVADVRLLDGGLTAWCESGHALHHGLESDRLLRTSGTNASVSAAAQAGARAGTDVGDAQSARWDARPDYLIHTAQARALLNTGGSALVSIRTRAEYLGETSGYSYIAARGEIAGAQWGHAGVDGDVNSMSNFQDALGRMKPAAEIAAQIGRAHV